MERVRFDFCERLRVGIPFAISVMFMLSIPLFFFRNLYSHAIPLIGFAVGFVFPMSFPLLPTRRFFIKALVLALIGVAGGGLYFWDQGLPAKDIVQWALIIMFLTTFISMDFSGMTPVTNYSQIRQEFFIIIPLLAVVLISYIAVSLLW